MSRSLLTWAAASIPVLASTLSGKPAALCTATEAQLLGNWKGGNSFEEMAFEQDSDGSHFNSWLHHRPDQIGLTWTLAQCDLKIINPENTTVEYRFYVKSVSRNRLVMIDAKDGLVERYRRIP